MLKEDSQFGVGLYARAWNGMWIVLDQLAGLGPTVLTDREQWPDRKGMLQAREGELMDPFINHGEGN